MTSRPTSWMGYEPTDDPEPTATLLTADEFNRKFRLYGGVVERDPQMERMYLEVHGVLYATELDGAVTC